MDAKKEALKYALQNAIQFNGNASPGAIIGKILSANPELKTKIKEVAKTANSAAEEVNRMDHEDQLKKLEKLAPELLEQKKQKRDDLKDLPCATKGKVITRIPPEPSKYAHIGHAISFMINYLYAKKYDGKCFLRFEDTNPGLSEQEYADAILEDLNYLGIKPDKVAYVSDDVEKFYDHALKLIQTKNAYVCECSIENVRENRRKGIPCNCRTKSVPDNENHWKKMLNGEFKAGESVLRLKHEMKSKNKVMRDPVLFRISYEKHYRIGDKHVVWPLYDFENAVEDGLMQVTHVLRSIEFGGMRVELQNRLKELLNLPKQTVIQYGRFNITDALSQGREIRQLIDSKAVKSWDDPRLVTIKALSRRGIQPETFKDLAIEFGISTTPTNVDWSVISAHNRKYLDAASSRYFFIENPKKIKIGNSPKQKLKLKLHPNDAKAKRNFSTGELFLISEKDYYGLRKLNGKLVRLMDCLNFVADEKPVFDSIEIDEYKRKGEKIIHWLPAESNVEAEILMPDASYVEGLAESNASKIKVGEIVQFARFGFCRLEKKEKKMQFIYCHE